MRYLLILVSALALTLTSCVNTQQVKIDGLPIKLGDSTTQVQAAFQTQLEAEPYENSVNKGGYSLQLRSKGVWTFFNNEGKAITIRLSAPFKGNVAGVKIGDTLLTLKTKLGEPVKKPFKFGMSDAYLYYPDDTYSARFDVNESGEVETIFIINTPHTTTFSSAVKIDPVSIDRILGNENLPHPDELDADKYNKILDQIANSETNLLDTNNKEWNSSNPKWKPIFDRIRTDLESVIPPITLNVELTNIEHNYKLDITSQLSKSDVDSILAYYDSPQGQRYQDFIHRIDLEMNSGVVSLVAKKTAPSTSKYPHA
jgi:hypothetical protein